VRALALAGFCGSGAASLIYEVCWIRQASLVFGSTTFALSSVLAVFFLGLAIGSEFFGRLAERSVKPIWWFAALELTLCMLGLASPLGFGVADAAYGSAYRFLEANGIADEALLFGVRFGLVAVVLLPPTVLMGGTLPLLCRQFVVDETRIAGSVGFLYGLNTLGAALGCAVAGTLLLPALGLWGSIASAALLNLLVGGIAAGAARSVPPTAASQARPSRDARGGGFSLIYPMVFVTGFVALGSEVLWTRFLALLVSNTVHTYTLTLTLVLVGIVLGSQLARLFDRVFHRAVLFGTLQIVAALLVLLLMLSPLGFWAHFAGDRFWIYGVLLLPPAILQGASFPLAVRIAVADPAEAAGGVGRLTALNVLGGIAGSLVVGFAGLPLLGMQKVLLSLTGLGIAVGVLAWLGLESRQKLAPRLALVVLSVGAWLALPPWLGTRLPGDFLARGGELVAFHEGLSSNLAVVRRRGVLNLNIDQLWQGRDMKSHQAVAAHIPMILHPEPRKVLLVGAGAGQTPSRFLMYPIELLACVDIEPGVFEVIEAHFAADWMRDERVQLLHADGRNYLAHSAERFDLISIEVGQIVRPGVPFFYTREFYQRALARLEPGGLLSQFVPLQLLAPDVLRSVIGTFLEVFPESVLFYNTSEMLLIGIRGDALALEPDRLALVSTDGPIKRDLEYSHWGDPEMWLNRPEVFVASYLLGRTGLERLAAGATILTDDRPILDYAVHHGEGRRMHEIAHAKRLSALLDPIDGLAADSLDWLDVASIERTRTRNVASLAAGAFARRARQAPPGSDERVRLLSRALQHDARNLFATRLLAETHQDSGEHGLAIPYFRRFLEMQAGDAGASRGLARALYKTGQLVEAVAEYERELARRPDSPVVHNELGVVLGELGQREAARQHFLEALRLRPGYSQARRNMGKLRAAEDGPAAVH
jgi:spermidine synthase